MRISRSEQKRRMKQVQELVAELADLSPQVIRQAPCPKEIQQLLIETGALRGSERQRSVRYITKLVLREQALEDLYTFIGTYRGTALEDKKQFHILEFYRDTLIDEAIEQERICQAENSEWQEDWTSTTLQELQTHLPGIDIRALSRLAYLFARTRNPRHSREIFRSLRAAQEQQQRTQKRGEGERSSQDQ
jgi:ribosome-associated protein